MMRKIKKEKINVLLNIDNYFGEHTGRLMPMMIFLGVCSAPFIFYTLFLSLILPFKIMFICEVLFAGRMALYILGEENKKLDIYLKTKKDEFASAYGLIKIPHIHKDGLIEYSNGKVAYILSGYVHSYSNDNKFSRDMEEFLHSIREYEYDIYAFNVVDELVLEENVSNLSVMQDKELAAERLDFYLKQDEYSRDNTKLFHYCFLIKTMKYNWKTLRDDISAICDSVHINVFKKSDICSKPEVADVISRDICAYIDLDKMLQDKYSNEQYFDSKVAFYGDDIPDEYKMDIEDTMYEDRRVIE